MRVEPGARRGAAERDLAEARQRVLDAGDALAHLRGVAGELLAEGHGNRVHPMCTPRLDDVGELRRLRVERRGELLHRRQEVVHDLVERREMDGGREDVVRRLAHVHVVVRVHALAGQRRDDLVRVHVRGGAGAGLEDVDRELVVELAGGDARRRRRRSCRPCPASRSPRPAFACAAAPLMRPSQRATDGGMGCPETGKLATAFVVSPPQSCCVESMLVMGASLGKPRAAASWRTTGFGLC